AVYPLLWPLPIPWLSLILSTGVGVATQIKGIGQQTVIQWQTSDPLLPKVFAAREWILTGTFGLASLGCGFLAEHFGVQRVFTLSAALLTLSAGWAWLQRKHLTIDEPRDKR